MSYDTTKVTALTREGIEAGTYARIIGRPLQ